MQLQLSFTVLLGSIIFALVQTSEAAPYVRGTALVKMPLTATRSRRGDLPAAVYLQQHINHANKRHRRAIGLDLPTPEEQAAALHKRIEGLPEAERHALARRYSRVGTDIKTPTLEARYNRFEMPAPAAKSGLAGTKAAHALGNAQSGNKNAAAKGNGDDNDADRGQAAATETAAAASATVTAAAAAGNGTAASANVNANGFSAEALKAQQADELAQSNTPKDKNSLALDIEANDVGYISTVQIGTPPKPFRLIMDSGSADLWVGGEKCQTIDAAGQVIAASCGQHQFLGSGTSSSFKDTRKAFQVTYGSGAVAGSIVTDNLSVGGFDIPAHTFGAAVLETEQFTGDEFIDGLMGLAVSTLSNQKVLTPPEAMAKAGLIQNAAVSYRIPRVADGLKDGQVTFGGVDSATVDQATLVTVDNLSKIGFWEAAMTVSVDGKDTGLKGRTAILDTGTTLILAPEADAVAIHSAIEGANFDPQNGFTVPCTTAASIAMTFGGKTYEIDPRDLLFTPIDPANPKGDCLSGIQPGTVGDANQWLVGDVFLKNVIFAHDVGKQAITLAKPAANAAAGAVANKANTGTAATASASASKAAAVDAEASASASESASKTESKTASKTASESASASTKAAAGSTASASGTASASDAKAAAATVTASASASDTKAAGGATVTVTVTQTINSGASSSAAIATATVTQTVDAAAGAKTASAASSASESATASQSASASASSSAAPAEETGKKAKA